MTAKQIVIERLKADGFSGLYNTWAECSCRVDDLAPCDGIQLECVALAVAQITDARSVAGGEDAGCQE